MPTAAADLISACHAQGGRLSSVSIPSGRTASHAEHAVVQEGPRDAEASTADLVRGGPRSLLPDKSLNLKVLRGEQDSHNPVSYSEWSRDAKDFIKSRGKTFKINFW